MLNAHEQVLKTITDLRAHIEKITRRPIDPDVDRYTDEISTLVAGYMLPTVDEPFDGIGLTNLQRRLIDLLSSRPAVTFSNDAIMHALYFDRAGDYPEDKIVDVFVCHVRAKLRAADSDFWIATVWGRGYRFVKQRARDGHSMLAHELKNHSHYALPHEGRAIEFANHGHVEYGDDD